MSAARDSFRRLGSLLVKECLQILRDPASLVIAFLLPPVLMFLFGFAVSLDVRDVPVAVVMESDDPTSRSLAAAFAASPYLEVTPARHRREVEGGLVSGDFKAFAVIPADFESRSLRGDPEPALQIITDASQPNTANFAAAYLQGAYNNWLVTTATQPTGPVIEVQQRVWFNPELDSKAILVPGSMAIVMTLIGTMLTALVMAREWERGTMEAIMATPASMTEIIVSKLLPYFLLAAGACATCTVLAVTVFGVEMRGSVLALALLSAAFLMPALGQGLLISAIARKQFAAVEAAMVSGFLPAFLLSGFLFEIKSMPTIIQWITTVIPARYYVSSLQTLFLAGDVWPQFLRDMAAMLAVGAVFFIITRARSRKSLDR